MATPTGGEPKPQSSPPFVPTVQYMTPPEIGKRLRVAVATVRQWIKSGRLAAIDVASNGRPKYRVRLEDLEAFEKSLRVLTEDTKTKPVTRRQKVKPYVNPFFPERG